MAGKGKAGKSTKRS